MRTRFSLRMLLFFVLTLGAGVSLALIWQPWQHRFTIRSEGETFIHFRYSSDGGLVVTQSLLPEQGRFRTTVWNNQGQALFITDWCHNTISGSNKSWAYFAGNSRYLYLFNEESFGHFALMDVSSRKMLFPESTYAADTVFSHNQQRVLVKFQDIDETNPWLAVYDLYRGEMIFQEREFFQADSGHGKRKMDHLEISPDGKWIAAIFQEPLPDDVSEVRFLLINVDTAQQRTLRWPLKDSCQLIRFSTDGSRLLAWGSGSLLVVDAASGETLFQIEDCQRIERDSKRTINHVLLLHNDNSTSLLNVSAPAPLQPRPIQTLPPHNSRVIGDWIAWVHKEILTLRNLQDGREFSTPWISERADDLIPHEPPWSIREDKGILRIYEFGKIIAFNTSSNLFVSKYLRDLGSNDLSRAVLRNATHSVVLALPDETPLGTIPVVAKFRDSVQWSPTGNQFAISDDNTINIIQRIRADEPRSLLYRIELWMTVLFGCGLVYSAVSDWKRFRAKTVA